MLMSEFYCSTSFELDLANVKFDRRLTRSVRFVHAYSMTSEHKTNSLNELSLEKFFLIGNTDLNKFVQHI